jgi:hypothetical protein
MGARWAMWETVEMIFDQKIEQAFHHRRRPNALVDDKQPLTSEQRSAIWFSGRNWRDISWEEWEEHRDAFYAFSSEAFAYYLPSFLVLSFKRPGQWFWPADALLQVLDRSPIIEHWDAFLTTRLVGLQAEEYEVLKEWIISLPENTGSAYGKSLDRALETVDLLQGETNRVRAMHS